MSLTRNGMDQNPMGQATTHRITPLIRALQTDVPEPISCAEFRMHMADLYHLQGAGTSLPAELSIYRTHLESCSDCRAEFSLLCKVMEQVEAGTLPALAQTPHFDLSFIHKATGAGNPLGAAAALPVPPPSLWLPALAAEIRTLIGDVIVRVQRMKAAFDPQPWLPGITLIPGPQLRDGTGTGQAELLVLPAPPHEDDADFSFQLTVGPVIAGTAAIMVKLLELSSGQPLAETRVTLRNGQRQLLIGSVTNAQGMTLFQQLPLGRYFIQVRHRDQTWEVPLVLVEGLSAEGAHPAK